MISMNKLEIKTLYKLDVLKGLSQLKLDGLESLILGKYEYVSQDIAGDTFELPNNVLITQIENELKQGVKNTIGREITSVNGWSHIHYLNMSTNLHDHYPCDLSSIFYLSVPEGSGNLVFYPNWFTHKRQNTIEVVPKANEFYIFPATLDHAVKRHRSKKPRISIVFNFNFIN